MASTQVMPPIVVSHPAVNPLGSSIGQAMANNGANAPYVPPAVPTNTLALSNGSTSGGNNGGGTIGDAIVNAINANNSSKRGDLLDPMPKPVQTIYTVNSVAGSGAAPITAYFMNEDLLTATPTNNGSGAGSVIETYNDGFSGNLLSQLSLVYGLEGIPYKQFQLTFTSNADGTQNKAALSNANPRKISYNGDTTSESQLLALASAGNPAYYQQGFLIIDINFRMRRNEQILLTIAVGTTATMILVPAY